jgi:hypothetical protein
MRRIAAPPALSRRGKATSGERPARTDPGRIGSCIACTTRAKHGSAVPTGGPLGELLADDPVTARGSAAPISSTGRPATRHIESAGSVGLHRLFQ